MRRLLLCFFVFAAFQNLWAQSSDLVFQSLRSSIFRVKIAESPKAPKTSYGTGFVVAQNGLVATNFHVVSDFANTDRSNNNIYIESDEGEYLAAELLSFSIEDDLALLKVKKNFPSAVRFSSKPLSKGEKIYSLGLPEDLQMSIVEGVYNGVEKSGPYEVFFLSSPINGGMSGGPTVNAQGELLGVNVSRLLFSEDISFAVPLSRLEKLLAEYQAQSTKQGLSPELAEKSSYQQLGNVSKKLFQDLSKADTMDVEIKRWGTVQLPKDLKCWSNVGNSKELNYESSTYSCRLNSSSFLSSVIQSGTYQMDFRTIVPKGARRWAMFMLLGDVNLSTRFSRVIDAFSSSESMKKYYSSYNCQNGFYEKNPKDHFNRWGLCLRTYKKNPEVLDVVYQIKKSQEDNFYLFKLHYEGLHSSNLDEFVRYWSTRSLKI